MNISYPFTWKENSPEDQKERGNFWKGINPNAPLSSVKQMISNPMGYNIPKHFIDTEMHMKIWKLKPRADDVWLLTYPKSGTTMVTELLWQMSTGCDVKSQESKKKLDLRTPYLDLGMYNISEMLAKASAAFDDEQKRLEWEEYVNLAKDSVQFLDNFQSPRIIKTHVPLSMLPPNVLETSKVILVARNPKDVCVSYYHQEQILPALGLPKGSSFDRYVDYFISGRPGCYGDYWEYNKDALKHKDHPNMKILWYEDLTTNFEEEVRGLSKFTGYELSDENMKTLMEHMKIDNMRDNSAINNRPPKADKNWKSPYVRKGGTGGWKNYFTNESTLKKFDEWIEKNNIDEFGNQIEGLRFE